MKVVEVQGSPREIGRSTGEALREEIRAHMALLPEEVRQEAWAPRLPAFLDTLRREVPEVLEEMEAMAEGADVPFEHIAALNLPKPASLRVEEGCTNVAFASGPDGPVWGKNNDGNRPDMQRPICCRIVRPAHGIPQVVFPFCGFVAVNDGMNAEGVAVGHSSVGSVFEQSEHHVPIRLWYYHCMMHARTTGDFVRLMDSRPLQGKGYSMVCVDRHGTACSIEAACPVIQVGRPNNKHGHVNCTNYYKLPQLAHADRRSPEGKCNAIARRELLDRMLDEGTDTSLEGMKAILRHHRTDTSPAICRHMGPDDGATHYSMIGLPESGRVLFYHGRPCEGDFETVSL